MKPRVNFTPDASQQPDASQSNPESETPMELGTGLNIGLVAAALAPQIIAGIETIHADAPGETKKQIALQSLQLATGTAAAVLPGPEGEAAKAAGGALGVLIDQFVGLFNKLGVFKHKKAAPAPQTEAPAATQLAAA